MRPRAVLRRPDSPNMILLQLACQLARLSRGCHAQLFPGTKVSSLFACQLRCASQNLQVRTAATQTPLQLYTMARTSLLFLMIALVCACFFPATGESIITHRLCN